jgi:hypothetical protein
MTCAVCARVVVTWTKLHQNRSHSFFSRELHMLGIGLFLLEAGLRITYDMSWKVAELSQVPILYCHRQWYNSAAE